MCACACVLRAEMSLLMKMLCMRYACACFLSILVTVHLVVCMFYCECPRGRGVVVKEVQGRIQGRIW